MSRPSFQLPEVDHLWISVAPRSWPAAPVDLPWFDWSRGRWGELGSGGAVELPPGPFEDVLYVPAVEPTLSAVRDAAVAPHVTAGTPVLVQLFPGETAPSGTTAAYDLGASLFGNDLTAVASLPPGCAVVWPLISGVTTAPELIEEGCRALAAAGVAVAQALVPELTPAERRRLAEGRPDDVFDALFHGPEPDPRAFAVVAHAYGLAPFVPRPLPRPPLGGAGNRAVAGELALAAELAVRLGRPEGRAQALFRAARWADRSHYDLAALARDGHLPVLDWLDEESREIVSEWATGGKSATVRDWLAQYLSAPKGGSP